MKAVSTAFFQVDVMARLVIRRTSRDMQRPVIESSFRDFQERKLKAAGLDIKEEKERQLTHEEQIERLKKRGLPLRICNGDDDG